MLPPPMERSEPTAIAGCPFCQVSSERIFHEGRSILGLWDGFPVSPGHALLVPRDRKSVV